MTGKPHEVFDFGRAEYCPDGQIARGVITPLVAKLTEHNNDWGRMIDSPGESFYDADGEFEGSHREVLLLTEPTDVPEGHSFNTGHNTRLIVTTRVEDTLNDLLNDGPSAREFVLKSAKYAALEKYGSLDVMDKKGYFVWTNGLEDNLVVSTEQFFMFDEQGLLRQESTRVIQGEDPDDVVRYPFDDKAKSPDYNPKSTDAEKQSRIGILLEDLIAIEAACKLLGAPKESIQELQRIKANPAEIY